MTVTRRADEVDAAVIADIYNQGIEEGGATFETTLRTAEQMVRRIAEGAERYPILVVEEQDRVLGWASINQYRPRACYDGIGEFSIYIHRAARGRGLGKGLLQALIAEAAALGYWKILSRVFISNEASRKLCRACGFREVGIYEKHAQINGRWIDVVIVERLISQR